MLYGLIIAAGKQTRFNSSVPKALYPIKDTNALSINVSNLEQVCDKIIVVCSYNNESWFSGDKYEKLTIESGLGCGDAVLQALRSIEFDDDDMVMIQWGDSIHSIESYNQLINMYHKDCLNILVREELSPYVSIETCPNKVRFSKFDETVEKGFHDLSLFMGNAKYILYYCEVFNRLYFSGLEYAHRHGNEFNFLDIINDTSIDINLVVINKHVKFVDFNTIEELLNKVSEYDAYESR